MVTIIANTLKDKRDLLKNKIETKYNTTCTSTTIIGLIHELNELVASDAPVVILPPNLTPITSVSERIMSVAAYLAQVLNIAGISATKDDGFTTLINKIDNISTKITPSISLNRSPTGTLSKGDTVTLTATITGDSTHGIPTGSVSFYEGTSTTPISTITTPKTTNSTTGVATYQTTVTKNINTTKSYTAKYTASSSSKYNDSDVSSSVSVTWYTAPIVKSDDNVTVSVSGTKTYGNTLSVSATGTGSISLGTSKGASDIGTISSGESKNWSPDAGSYTVWAVSSGSSTVNSGSASTSVTINKANYTPSLSFNPQSIRVDEYTNVTAYGAGKIDVGTSSGGSDLASDINSGGTCKYTGTSSGTKTIYVTSKGDSNYKGGNNSRSITVNKWGTSFNKPSSSVKKGESFVVYLVDEDGKGIAGQHVSITAKGTPQGSTTEYSQDYDTTSELNTGKLSVDLNLSWGNTTIDFSYSFDGNSKYKATSGSKKITYTS